jgi:hypothetical protein
LKDYSQFKKKYRFLITWISKNYFCFYYCYWIILLCALYGYKKIVKPRFSIKKT